MDGGFRGKVGDDDGPTEEEIRAGQSGEARAGASPAVGGGDRRLVRPRGRTTFFLLPVVPFVVEISLRCGRKPCEGLARA